MQDELKRLESSVDAVVQGFSEMREKNATQAERLNQTIEKTDKLHSDMYGDKLPAIQEKLADLQAFKGQVKLLGTLAFVLLSIAQLLIDFFKG